jgi:tape measure domain-containing protein
MGLLNSITVRFNADLSPLKAARADAISDITAVADSAKSATSVFKDMQGSINGGRIVTDEDVAKAKLTLIEEKVAEAREKFLGMRASLDLGEAVTGLPEAEANLTLLERQAQDAREQLAQLGQQAETTGSEVEEGTSRASGGFGGFLDRVKGMGSGLLDFGAKIGQTIFGLQTLGQTAVSIAGNLLAPAASAKEIQSSLEVFDGSTEKAKAELQSLATFAANTPFDTTTIDEAALHLQGVGINAKDVQPDILALGDALDAMGDTSSADLQGLVDDFSKIQTQGHLTTDVMNSFALRGIDAWKVLEDQTGKSRSQLQDMISKGLYPADQAMKDLTQGIEKSPLYHGQMANDTKGWAGALSNLKANFDQVLVSLGSPIIDGLVPIFNDIGQTLSSPAFKDFAGNIGQGIANVFGKVATAAKNVDFKTIGDDVQKLGDWFKNSMQPALEQAEPSFSQLATTVGNLASSALPPLLQAAGDLAPKVVTLAGDIAGGLNTAITTITGSFNTWGPIVAGVGITLTVVFIPAIIKSGVESVIAGGKLAGQFIANVVKTGIEGWSAAGKLALFIGNLIATGAQAIWAGIQISAQFVANIVKAGAEAVIAGGKIVASFIGSLIEAAAQAAITGAAFLADLIPSIISMTADAIVFAATAIPAILAGFASWVIGAAAVAIANIAAFWPIYLVVAAIIIIIGLVVLAIQHWGDIVKWLQGVWNAISGFFIGLFNGIVDFFKKWGLTILEILMGPVGLIIMFWKPITAFFAGIWNDITKIFGVVGTWFHDRWNDAINGVKTILNGLKTFAQGIWNDIANGAKGALNWAIDQINNVIGGINTVSGALHIPAIPLIPHLSTGGTIDPGTFAIVGDPTSSELVYGGQAGATVFSHSQSMAMLAGAGAGGGKGGDTHVHIYLDSQEIAHYSAESTADLVVNKLLGHGPVRGAA